MEKPTAREYANMLRGHDWWYMMSDASSTYSAGRDREKHLIAMSKGDEELERIFSMASSYHRSLHPVSFEVASNWAKTILSVNGVENITEEELPVKIFKGPEDSWMIDHHLLSEMIKKSNLTEQDS